MNLQELTDLVVAFREKRDWAQFHHPKELASALSIEVAEIMELFRFKTPSDIAEELKNTKYKGDLAAELADTLFLLLLLSHESEIPLEEAFEKKMKLLEERYPVDKVKGRNDKWTAYAD